MKKFFTVLLLLLWYKYVIYRVGKMLSVDRIHRFLIKTHTNLGVCNCCNNILHIGIYSEDWVERNYTFGAKWDQYPTSASSLTLSKEVMLCRLITRENTLRKELFLF